MRIWPGTKKGPDTFFFPGSPTAPSCFRGAAEQRDSIAGFDLLDRHPGTERSLRENTYKKQEVNTTSSGTPIFLF